MRDALKLTVYFGERDRAGGAFLADALAALYARHGFATSIIVRGVEGFGAKHALHTDRLLTLSEDLPLVSIAVDSRARIEAALPELTGITGDGLISLERARLAIDGLAEAAIDDGPTKLTLYVGRNEKVGRRPAYLSAVDSLRRHGAAGATVLLGVDGTLHGERRRARFFASNADVPLMLLAVGAGAALRAALPELEDLFDRPVATLERVQVCKRDGERVAAPHHLPERDPSGLAIWQKLTVHNEAQTKVDGRPLHVELVRRLRAAEAAGATALRGIWGFYGERAPFGDRFLSLRRQVPVHTVIVDTPAAVQRWWAVVDEVTSDAGLVTSELVPASRAVGGRGTRGGLRLASP